MVALDLGDAGRLELVDLLGAVDLGAHAAGQQEGVAAEADDEHGDLLGSFGYGYWEIGGQELLALEDVDAVGLCLGAAAVVGDDAAGEAAGDLDLGHQVLAAPPELALDVVHPAVGDAVLQVALDDAEAVESGRVLASSLAEVALDVAEIGLLAADGEEKEGGQSELGFDPVDERPFLDRPLVLASQLTRGDVHVPAPLLALARPTLALVVSRYAVVRRSPCSP